MASILGGAQIPAVHSLHAVLLAFALAFFVIGSNSNIAERGITAEVSRVMIEEVDPATEAYREFATGLRNPTALAVQSQTGQLGAAVNERDELGPNLVPDDITSVREGAFDGWPYSYRGQHIDLRVRPQDPQEVASAVRPDYSLGSHVAPLGIAFSSPATGPGYADDAFVGEHGNWNRHDLVGYNVFVPFRGGRPTGPPLDFVAGFFDEERKARGRPVGGTVDPQGALIVADSFSNTVWRAAPPRRTTAAMAPGPNQPPATR